MLKKVFGIFTVFVALMFFASCENDTHSQNEDEYADDEKTNEKTDEDTESPDDIDENLTKGDLSGCLVDEGEGFYPVPKKVSLNEKNESAISFYYQDQFYCAGNDFYYLVTPDEADETLLHVYLKAVNIMNGSLPGCDCPMRIGMEFSSEDQDLTKVEKVEIDYDFYWNEERENNVFSFEKINCFYKSKVYEEGDSLTDWCNLCGCTKYGDVACDEMECSFCEKGATMEYSCGDEKEIKWCECTDPEEGWECLEDPGSLCEEEIR